MAHTDTTNTPSTTKSLRKRFENSPRPARLQAIGQVIGVLAAPAVIKASRSSAIDMLTFQTLSDGPADRAQIRGALALLQVLDAVEADRHTNKTVGAQIDRLNKSAETVADPALAAAYRTQAAELVQQSPRPSDVAALRKAAATRRAHAEAATTGADAWQAHQAADAATAEADRLEYRLKVAGVPLTASSSADEHYRGLASQVRNLHGQIDDVLEKMGHPRPQHVPKITKAAGVIDRWEALAADYADVATRTKTLQTTVINTGPRRIRSQVDMTKASTHDAGLTTAAHYRRLADATSDRVLRQGYTEMANEIESRIKKGNQK